MLYVEIKKYILKNIFLYGFFCLIVRHWLSEPEYTRVLLSLKFLYKSYMLNYRKCIPVKFDAE